MGSVVWEVLFFIYFGTFFYWLCLKSAATLSSLVFTMLFYVLLCFVQRSPGISRFSLDWAFSAEVDYGALREAAAHSSRLRVAEPISAPVDGERSKNGGDGRGVLLVSLLNDVLGVSFMLVLGVLRSFR